MPGLDDGLFADLLFPAGDEVEDQLGDIGVVADDDEHRRRDAAGAGLGVLLPQAVILLVVAVEAVQRPLQFDRELRFAADRVGLASLFGQVLADAQPEVAVGGLVAGHRVVGHRHAGHLDDAGLDGVDEREIRDHPGKERAFGIAGTAQEERRGRKIIDRLHADLGFHGLDAGNPDAGLFVALLGFDAFIAGERFILAVGFAAVAVMGFVVEDDDVLLGAQLAADAADHLVGSFGERARLPVRRESTLVSLPAATFSRSWKAWKLVMTILACPSCSCSWAGTMSRWR